MTPRRARSLVAGLLALCLAPAAAGAAEPGFVPIDLHARPIDSFLPASGETRFGALEFRGGIVVTSGYGQFGSLSGIDFAADGRTIVAVADSGQWFTARLVESGGRLTGIADGQFGPILDYKGTPLSGKNRGDAEGLRLVHRNGQEIAFVSFEGVNDVRQFTPFPDLAHAQSRQVALLKSVRGLNPNKGLEAIAVAPADGPFAGAIVLVAERSLDPAGNNRAWVNSGPRAGPFSIRRSDNFDVTDAAFLPEGDLLILERKFSIADGIAMRIRRISGSAIRLGATVDGEVLIQADMRYQIDNMEGMAVRRNADGSTTILIVSDDNLSVLQRTMLLEFALPAMSPPMPPARPAAQ